MVRSRFEIISSCNPIAQYTFVIPNTFHSNKCSSPKYHHKYHANWIIINIMSIFITDIQVFAYGKIIDILHFEVLL